MQKKKKMLSIQLYKYAWYCKYKCTKFNPCKNKIRNKNIINSIIIIISFDFVAKFHEINFFVRRLIKL